MERSGGNRNDPASHPLWLHGKGEQFEFDLQLEFTQPIDRPALMRLKAALGKTLDEAATAIERGKL